MEYLDLCGNRRLLFVMNYKENTICSADRLTGMLEMFRVGGFDETPYLDAIEHGVTYKAELLNETYQVKKCICKFLHRKSRYIDM